MLPDKGFLDALSRARDKKVIDKGSLVIFRDYIESCSTKIRKNNDLIQRLIGQNDQLKLTSSMMTEVLNKYTRLQEDADKLEEANRKLKEEDSIPDPQPKPVKKKKARTTTRPFVEEVDRGK